MPFWLSRTIPMSKYLSGCRPLRHNEVQLYYHKATSPHKRAMGRVRPYTSSVLSQGQVPSQASHGQSWTLHFHCITARPSPLTSEPWAELDPTLPLYYHKAKSPHKRAMGRVRPYTSSVLPQGQVPSQASHGQS